MKPSLEERVKPETEPLRADGELGEARRIPVSQVRTPLRPGAWQGRLATGVRRLCLQRDNAPRRMPAGRRSRRTLPFVFHRARPPLRCRGGACAVLPPSRGKPCEELPALPSRPECPFAAREVAAAPELRTSVRSFGGGALDHLVVTVRARGRRAVAAGGDVQRPGPRLRRQSPDLAEEEIGIDQHPLARRGRAVFQSAASSLLQRRRS